MQRCARRQVVGLAAGKPCLKPAGLIDRVLGVVLVVVVVVVGRPPLRWFFFWGVRALLCFLLLSFWRPSSLRRRPGPVLVLGCEHFSAQARLSSPAVSSCAEMATPLGNGRLRQDMPPKGGFPKPE